MQETCFIIAASSSVLALSAAGITPDIVIATDGGNWALKHIYPFFRDSCGGMFAVNLCAALPSQCKNIPQLLINDGSFWQSIILHELSLPSVIIPQKGTVTAAAVELAFILSGDNIYMAGMDLSIKDIRTHVRPYGFDSIFLNKANRLTPFYSESFTRSSLIQKGGSMDIYASWFKTQEALWPKRLYSICGNGIFKEGIPSGKSSADKKDSYFKAVSINKDSNNFRRRGVSALLKAMKNPEYAHSIKNELKSLLFSGQDKITDCDIENEIKKIVFVNPKEQNFDK